MRLIPAKVRLKPDATYVVVVVRRREAVWEETGRRRSLQRIVSPQVRSRESWVRLRLRSLASLIPSPGVTDSSRRRREPECACFLTDLTRPRRLTAALRDRDRHDSSAKLAHAPAPSSVPMPLPFAFRPSRAAAAQAVTRTESPRLFRTSRQTYRIFHMRRLLCHALTGLHAPGEHRSSDRRFFGGQSRSVGDRAQVVLPL